MAARKRKAPRKPPVSEEQVARALKCAAQLRAMGALEGSSEYFTRMFLAEKGWTPAAIDMIMQQRPALRMTDDVGRLIEAEDGPSKQYNPPPAMTRAAALGGQGTFAPMATREIDLAMGALEREVDRLFSETHDMIGRLGPVLSPTTPSTVEETRPSFPVSAAALPGHIVDIARKCAAAGDHVVDALKRLQV
jgi:hypothetical protein